MRKKVFVLGELNVDLIVTGSDVTPEWNKEKLVDSFELVLGSSSAITACGLSGLGMEVCFVSVIGDDMFGRFVLSELQRHGVDTRYVTIDPNLRTGAGLSLSTEQDRALLTFMGSIPALQPKHFPEEMLQEAHHIHFGSYYLQESMRLHWGRWFERAREAGVTTSFDTGWDPKEVWYREDIFRLLKNTSLFLPSEAELLQMTGKGTVEEALACLPDDRGTVAVKRGEKGALLSRNAGETIHSGAFPVVPVDTTGAGDSFDAGMIHAFLQGFEEKKALEWANACGAIATQRIGGASTVPNLREVNEFIMKYRN